MANTLAHESRRSAYIYARGNPNRFVDPNGLYVLEDECPNWSKALQLVKEKAGCATGGSQCKCKSKLPCDVCGILENGRGPWAYVVENPYYSTQRQNGKSFPVVPERGPLQHNWGASVIIGPKGSDTSYGEGPVVTWTEFRHGICFGGLNSSVHLLAKAMLHEALHQCRHSIGDVRSFKNWPMSTTDHEWPPWQNNAKRLTNECFGDEIGD
jgi:hypothetical protein